MRSAALCVTVALLSGCGRSGLPAPAELVVQVVDERDEPVSGAKVVLRADPTDPEQDAPTAVTSDLGIAAFEYPGPGLYHLYAATDLTCCLREGERDATVEGPGELLIVEARTGPCPFRIPTWCG